MRNRSKELAFFEARLEDYGVAIRGCHLHLSLVK
jgi:hypothetical protein